MFGGIGLFQKWRYVISLCWVVVYSLNLESREDKKRPNLDCEKYRHVKKQTTTTVNYYDITDLFVDTTIG